MYSLVSIFVFKIDVVVLDEHGKSVKRSDFQLENVIDYRAGRLIERGSKTDDLKLPFDIMSRKTECDYAHPYLPKNEVTHTINTSMQ